MAEDTQPAQDTGAADNPLAEVGGEADSGGVVESNPLGYADGDKPSDAQGEGEQENQPEGAPEKYEPFTVPEGVTISEEVHAKFSEVAKGLNLTQEQAQTLVDYQQGLEAQARAEMDDQLKAWTQEVKALPESDKVLGLAKRAVEKFADQEMKDMLYAPGSWLGHHPGIIKMLAKVGEVISESRFIDGNSAAPAPEKTYEEILYGS